MDKIYLQLVATGRQDLANSYLASINEKDETATKYNSLSTITTAIKAEIKSKKSSSKIVTEITAILKGI